jgi:hypothetical protein
MLCMSVKLGWDWHFVICNMLGLYENCYEIFVEKMKGPTYEAWETSAEDTACPGIVCDNTSCGAMQVSWGDVL